MFSLNKHLLKGYYVLSTVLATREVSSDVVYEVKQAMHFQRCPLVFFCIYPVLKPARVFLLQSRGQHSTGHVLRVQEILLQSESLRTSDLMG